MILFFNTLILFVTWYCNKVLLCCIENCDIIWILVFKCRVIGFKVRYSTGRSEWNFILKKHLNKAILNSGLVIPNGLNTYDNKYWGGQ